MYKDATIFSSAIYYSKTDKANTTTAISSFSTLVADDATFGASKTYTPLSVWASHYAFGMAVGCKNETVPFANYNYPIWNFVNESATQVDSGLKYTSVSDSFGGAIGLVGWPSATGYTLIGTWTGPLVTPAAAIHSYQMGTFYVNGTVFQAASTLADVQGPVNFFHDVNGALWVGWTAVDTANSLTYAGYLAKYQEQSKLPEEIESNMQINYYFVGIILSTLVFVLAHNLISIWE